MKFIDLFAGLGGFHNALSQLGHECVFSSEINENLRDLYKKNYDCNIQGDITEVDETKIPKHDILCAGFPCQPFSHAGRQQGLHDKKNGNLFFEIIRILKFHKSKYFILENVANLLTHDNGNTWNEIRESLENLGYTVKHSILSPHQFGIPHNRKRIFIVGVYEDNLNYFNWPKNNEGGGLSIQSILDPQSANIKSVPERELQILNIWQEFLDNFPKEKNLPSFPIWTTEFGADYPFESGTVYHLSPEELGKYKGSFGIKLEGLSYDSKLSSLPKYSLFGMDKGVKQYPEWKIRFIKQNRLFYIENKKILDPLIKKLKKFPLSFQKFEWNCGGEERNVFRHIIQFRASGVRVKRDDTSPALISSTASQIPIIAREKRYLSVHEASKLQGMGNLKYLPENTNMAFKALGNAVNSDVVKLIVKNFLP